MKILRILGSCLAFAAIAFALPGEERDEEKAVIETMQRCYQSLSSRDFLALRQCFWPQAIITTYWKRTPKSKAPEVYVQYLEEFIVNASKSFGQLTQFSQVSRSHEINQYDNIAQVWSVYEMKFTTKEGKAMTWRGVDMFHLMRHEGQWKIVALTYTKESPDFPLLDAYNRH
jgi:hypothetical protein